jgi:hypothetical protein
VGSPKDVCARTAADIPALEDVVRDLPFPLAALRIDGPSRTVVLPFERKHPRRESWELVVRGVRSIEEDGRVQQATDYFRSLGHDARAGVVTIQAVLVRVRLRVDALDLEARCLTKEAESTFDVVDLPADIRREIEVRGTDQVQRHERYEKADRERVVGMTVLGAASSVLLGLLPGSPWWWLSVHAAGGAAVGRWMAVKRWHAIPIGAAALGLPNGMLAVAGCLVAGRGLSREMGFALIAVSLGSGFAGVAVALLHGRMLERVEEFAFRGGGQARKGP